MQHHKQIIQLSDHVKNKIKHHQPTPLSLSSDELILSDNTDDNNNSVVLSSPQKIYHRRSTFTTYQIQHKDKQMQSPKQQRQLCQECLRRNNLLYNEHQRLLHIYNENKKLNKQLYSLILLNNQYQEENSKLKYYLIKLNTHLQEYQIKFDLLKKKILSEQNNKSKQNIEIDQLKRLRHELHIYNQVIATKRQEEQKEFTFFSHRNLFQKNK